MSNFFPMRLVKTCDLDPKGNYMFAYHPHGIISLGAFCMFGTEARSFSSVFPGIDLRVLTLSSNFTYVARLYAHLVHFALSFRFNALPNYRQLYY